MPVMPKMTWRQKLNHDLNHDHQFRRSVVQGIRTSIWIRGRENFPNIEDVPIPEQVAFNTQLFNYDRNLVVAPAVRWPGYHLGSPKKAATIEIVHSAEPERQMAEIAQQIVSIVTDEFYERDLHTVFGVSQHVSMTDNFHCDICYEPTDGSIMGEGGEFYCDVCNDGEPFPGLRPGILFTGITDLIEDMSDYSVAFWGKQLQLTALQPVKPVSIATIRKVLSLKNGLDKVPSGNIDSVVRPRSRWKEKEFTYAASEEPVRNS